MKHRVPLLLVPLLMGLPMHPADGSPAPQLAVELRARPLQPAPDHNTAHAEGAQGRIDVEGMLPTPTPCYDLAGEAKREGGVVTLTITANRQEGGCIQVIAGFAYEATVRGVPPGRYTVRVVHAWAGTGWETATAAERAVEVR